MKYIILSLLLGCAIASTTYADVNFTTSWGHRERPNGLMITGICVVSAGGVVTGIGALAALLLSEPGEPGNNNTPTPPYDYTGVYILGAGIVMIAGGITLIAVGKSKQRNQRWGVISAKRNEFGIAYNFK